MHKRIHVIKVSGKLLEDTESQEAFTQVLKELIEQNMSPVLVHGGGVQISHLCESLGFKVSQIEGRRVTDLNVLRAVLMAMCGEVSQTFGAKLNSAGLKVLPMSGASCSMVQVTRRPPQLRKNHPSTGKTFEREPLGGPKKESLGAPDNIDQKPDRNLDMLGTLDMIDYGYVGDLVRIESHILIDLISIGVIPLISSIGIDDKGQLYNINADTLAVALTLSLKAESLKMVTDVSGIYEDPQNPESRIPTLTLSGLGELKQKGALKDGMLPKYEAISKALLNGVDSVHVLGRKDLAALSEDIKSGRTPHCGTLIQRQ